MLALYTEERHGPLVGLLNQDLKSFTLTWVALSTWMLGYPEQAVKISDAQDAPCSPARASFQPEWSLTYGALVFEHVGEPEELLKRVGEGERVGRENSLPFVTEVLYVCNFELH